MLKSDNPLPLFSLSIKVLYLQRIKFFHRLTVQFSFKVSKSLSSLALPELDNYMRNIYAINNKHSIDSVTSTAHKYLLDIDKTV